MVAGCATQGKPAARHFKLDEPVAARGAATLQEPVKAVEVSRSAEALCPCCQRR